MNKKSVLHLLTMLFMGLLLFSACTFTTVRGSGNVVEETREVSGITGVNLGTLGDLTITLGDTESLIIEAEENLLQYFQTEVRNGMLHINTSSDVQIQTTRPVRYFLTVTNLDTIEISSSGNITAPDLNADRFAIEISSSGELEMGDLNAGRAEVSISSSGDVNMGLMNAETLTVEISSSGNLDIAGGEVDSQNIDISSSGNYTAPDLASNEADVRITSSGNATIWVQDRLRADLSSSGNVNYRGNPTVDATTSSSGQVMQISE